MKNFQSVSKDNISCFMFMPSTPDVSQNMEVKQEIPSSWIARLDNTHPRQNAQTGTCIRCKACKVLCSSHILH